MVLGDRGFLLTLATVMMSLVILSLILFYTDVTSPTFDDSTNKMSINELHYYAESLKNDASRATAISAQRAASYAIQHVIGTNETMRNYGMANCTGFTYYANGSDAAISELMLCGTLNHAVKPKTDIEAYMKNNTIQDWIGRVNGTRFPPFKTRIVFRNMSLAQVDSWHYAVIAEYDIEITDLGTGNAFRAYSTPIMSVIDISTMEDPLQHVRFGVPASVKLFSECPSTTVVNGSVLDGWIDEGCYHSAARERNSPSFFDRLEGNSNLTLKYVDRSSTLLAHYNYTLGEMGLEGLVNAELLKAYNAPFDGNLSQVDYMYMNGIPSSCSVDGMKKHPDFRVDVQHAMDYDISGLDCSVDVFRDGGSGAYTFVPQAITVPEKTVISWVERAGISHDVYASGIWAGTRTLNPSGRLQYGFNDSMGPLTVEFKPAGSPSSPSGYFTVYVIKR
jgi:hypothetical protein